MRDTETDIDPTNNNVITGKAPNPGKKFYDRTIARQRQPIDKSQRTLLDFVRQVCSISRTRARNFTTRRVHIVLYHIANESVPKSITRASLPHFLYILSCFRFLFSSSLVRLSKLCVPASTNERIIAATAAAAAAFFIGEDKSCGIYVVTKAIGYAPPTIRSVKCWRNYGSTAVKRATGKRRIEEPRIITFER